MMGSGKLVCDGHLMIQSGGAVLKKNFDNFALKLKEALLKLSQYDLWSIISLESNRKEVYETRNEN